MDPPRFCWNAAALSDVGLVRRMNEDACLDASERGIWAVADGMGGHACGDTASRMIVEALAQVTVPQSLLLFVQAVKGCLQSVNQALRAAAARRGVAVIGSTVVVVLAIDGDCAVLWAGDSRVYLLRQGVLQQLTRDHSQVAEAALASGASGSAGGVAGVAGAASVAGAAGSSLGALAGSSLDNHAPGPAPGSNVVTRAVGAADVLELDELLFSVDDGDVLLLCSDGLTRELSDADIARTLLPGNCRLASQTLIALALQRGGRDNVSVVVLAVDDLCSADRTVINPGL